MGSWMSRPVKEVAVHPLQPADLEVARRCLPSAVAKYLVRTGCRLLESDAPHHAQPFCTDQNSKIGAVHLHPSRKEHMLFWHNALCRCMTVCQLKQYLQDFSAASASGSYITCADTGKQYLDMACGIGVTSTGHSHPAVSSAIAKQAETFLFAQQNCSPYHAALVNSIKSLKRVIPENLDKMFFTNSGSEAIDNAVKIARFATGKPNIIVFDGSFHGRTVGAMSLTTSKTIFSQGMQIKMPGVVVAPFPFCLHCPVRSPAAHVT